MLLIQCNTATAVAAVLLKAVKVRSRGNPVWIADSTRSIQNQMECVLAKSMKLEHITPPKKYILL